MRNWILGHAYYVTFLIISTTESFRLPPTKTTISPSTTRSKKRKIPHHQESFKSSSGILFSSIIDEDNELENRETYDNNNNNKCKVVANGDGKLPSIQYLSSDSPSIISFTQDDESSTTEKIVENIKYLTQKINAIYGAEELQRRRKPTTLSSSSKVVDKREESDMTRADFSTIKNSLEDAGFELLNQSDLDLCDALNSGYLLRLSIAPDTKFLDFLGDDFFPSLYPPPSNPVEKNEKNSLLNIASSKMIAKIKSKKKKDYLLLGKNGISPLLFDGKVLIFRRGYSSQISRERFILPKIDYLQTSIVQSATYFFSKFVTDLELGTFLKEATKKIISIIPSNLIKMMFLEDDDIWSEEKNVTRGINMIDTKKSDEKKSIDLSRYGGGAKSNSPDDVIKPFLVCETDDAFVNITSLQTSMNSSSSSSSSSYYYRLLERVSVRDIIDGLSNRGRVLQLLQRLFSETTLVEPTYEEVVVIWRPISNKNHMKKDNEKKILFTEVEEEEEDISQPEERKKAWFLPSFVGGKLNKSDQIQSNLQSQKKENEKIQPVEIRMYKGVPMANVLGCLPKARLIFRPADAFVFDLISSFSLIAVLTSQRYDNPKLDLIAFISLSVWILRTFFRYSNKLARYDLLHNKFITDKISQKGDGAMKYISSEANDQRATRAGLLHFWMIQEHKRLINNNSVNHDVDSIGYMGPENSLSVEYVKKFGNAGINDLLENVMTFEGGVNVNIEAAIRDLEEFNLIEYHPGSSSFPDGKWIKRIIEGKEAEEKLKERWIDLF